VKQYPLYIFDLDGTLYRGDEALPGASEVVNELRRRGSLIRFLTNNSGRTPEFYAEKLRRLGFICSTDEIYSSATGSARWCAEQGIQSAFVVGEEGLYEALSAGKIRIVGLEEPAEAIVAGICRTFTYQWMNDAMQQILKGARFVATNADATYPLEGGRLEPGAGSIVAAIQTCSGADPVVVGKPNPYLVELILRDANISASECLAVGDRMETDIEAGRRANCDVHLVLTGVTAVAPEGVPNSADLRELL
jgi:4-nitrophenyl phosphatase